MGCMYVKYTASKFIFPECLHIEQGELQYKDKNIEQDL